MSPALKDDPLSVRGPCGALEARYVSGSAAGAVVAPPHPQMGGELHNPVVAALCSGLALAGFATLRFNFRGVGESAGSPSGSLDDAVADYGAALAALGERSNGPPLLAGYSFGAAAALALALDVPDCHGLLLVSPPTSMLVGLSAEDVSSPVHIMVGDADSFAPISSMRAWCEPHDHVRLHVVVADHFYSYGGLDQVQALAASLAG